VYKCEVIEGGHRLQRLDEIQVARGLAIIGVLLVHATNTALTSLDSLSTLYPFYNFIYSLGKLGTPTFIMLSSFILFYTYFRRDLTPSLIGSFYKKRFKYILIPYVVFSLFYFFVKFEMYQFANWNEAFDRLTFLLTWGKAHPHLYFVIISVQFYILFPFLLLLFKKVAFVRKYALFIGIFVQVLWLYLNRQYFQVDFKGSVIFSYSAYYMLGAFVGVYYDDIKLKMQQTKFRDLLIGGIVFCFGISLCFYFGYNYLSKIQVWQSIVAYIPVLKPNNASELFWGSYTFFASLVVLLIANYIVRANGKIKTFFMQIGAVSFGIYLIHPYYLMLFREWFTGSSIGLFHLQQLFTFIGVFVLSYLTVYLAFRFIPGSWIAFGKKD